jgi:hypothetical protein
MPGARDEIPRKRESVRELQHFLFHLQTGLNRLIFPVI